MTKLLPGEVALVGAGPGDPELLTVRAFKILQLADVIVYDRLVSKEIMTQVPRETKTIYVGKQEHRHTMPQPQINQLLVKLAHARLRVVRLKGGDSLIFGRGGEEIEHLLAEGISCQIIPGITAASGCTSYAGIPLTHRGMARGCTFVTGHLQDGELDLPWASLAGCQHTLVFYMGLRTLPVISQQLINHGLPKNTPAALIEQGTSEKQNIYRSTLQNLPELALQEEPKPPTLIVVGEVTALFSQADLTFPARLTPKMNAKSVFDAETAA